MKQLYYFFLIFIPFGIYAQDASMSQIKEMNWDADYSIELKMENDSIYVYNVRNLHHTDADRNTRFNNITYYPTNLSEHFISKLKKKGVELGIDTIKTDSAMVMKDSSQEKTLWSAIHGSIGGDFVHFVNTLLYAIENDYLSIRSPLMKRPETNWKPDPPTESWERTKRWEYYIPVNQRKAHKEYEIRDENNSLGDLNYLPEKWTDLFVNTNNRKYKRMIKNKEVYKIARIDLVKLLLGANYLGKPQIKYIKHMVLKGVMEYSKNRLPSVIVFENYNAAVALKLDEKGYHIEKIVFSDASRTDEPTLERRRETIKKIIQNINEVNKDIFKEKLEKHYAG
ncbi:MAG: hypothetical protein ACOCUV_03645 [bacterium]